MILAAIVFVAVLCGFVLGDIWVTSRYEQEQADRNAMREAAHKRRMA